MADIAFLGLGLMGTGMAYNLLSEGHGLRVWNRTAEKCQPLVDAGALMASTPAQAVDEADAIITIVGDDSASKSIWLGNEGILAGNPSPNAIAIESTTVSRDWVVSLGQRCVENGLRFLDCPVTGGPDGAKNGELTLLVGGDSATLEFAEPILQAYSSRIFHFGPIGAGTAYKLIVNAVGAVHAVAIAEAMLVAERAGLPLDLVAEALGKGSVASSVTSYIAPRMAAENHHEVRFAAKWRGKDAAYCCSMSESLACSVPTFERAADIFRQAIESGWGEANESAIQYVVQENS